MNTNTNFEINSSAPVKIIFRYFPRGEGFEKIIEQIPHSYNSFTEKAMQIIKSRGFKRLDGIKALSKGKFLSNEKYFDMFNNVTSPQTILVAPVYNENTIY
jgi:hypothetical protein